MVLFFTVWIHFCSVFFAHPVYISMTNMDIDAQKGDIVMSIRIFTHELETILHNKYHVDGWLGFPNEHPDGRRLLEEYVNERFSISVNNDETLQLVTDSITIADDSMWFYMKGTVQQSIDRIEVDNRLLTDFFSQQTNLMIINTGRKEEGYRLNRRNHKIELSL